MRGSRSTLVTVRKNLRRRVGADIRVSGPPEGVRFERDVVVTARDGTRLQANVFRPEAPGTFPVLLSASTYGKDRFPAGSRSGRAKPLQYRMAANDGPMSFSAWTALEAPDPAYWVPHGYVLVSLDLRGWGSSDGEPEPFGPHEGQDLHDAVEWAAAQPWSNGRIGMSGVSYLAISQWAAAATRPPHLAAICPWEGFTDAYSDFAYPGGIRENGFIRVWSAWQRAMRPSSPSFRSNQKRHPLRDHWWQDRASDLSRIDVPALVCASFSDHNLHSRGSFHGYAGIASEHKWLYTHRGPKWSTYYGAEAVAAQTRFFDHFLAGKPTGVTDTARVRVEIRAGLHEVVDVRGAQEWPPEQVEPLTLHLDATDGRLRDTPPSDDTTVTVRAAARFRWVFAEETDVVGPMRLRVPVSTDGGDLTLFAGVRMVRDGREVLFEGSYGFTEDIVTRGWLRAGHRAVDGTRSTTWEAFHPHTALDPMPAGEVVDLDLTLLPSATRFRAGDELVLELRDRYFFKAPPLLGQFPAVYARSRSRWDIHTGPSRNATLTVPVWTGPASSREFL